MKPYALTQHISESIYSPIRLWGFQLGRDGQSFLLYRLAAAADSLKQTGDAPLTVFQSIPLDGIIIVTSPQELVSMIVSKAVEMAQMMNVPVLGLIENYSYVKCPGCGEPFKVFGESHIDEVAAKYGLKVLGRIPLDPQIASLCDRGVIELFEGDWLDEAADAVEAAKKEAQNS